MDTKIETNNRINKLLEEMAQTLYRSWFVDFDPYDEFKDSELGEIPVGFEVTSFSELCETTGGGPRENTDQYMGNEYNWLRPSDMQSSNVSVFYDTEKKLNQKGVDESAATLMPPDSILLSATGTIGEVAINKEPMATNQNFMCIEPNEDVPSHYLLNLIRTKRELMENLGSGTTYPMLTQTSFESIDVPVAPPSDRLDYEKIVEPLYDEITHNLRENDNLAELRDTLLPKLMSGEIRLDPDSNNEPTTND